MQGFGSMDVLCVDKTGTLTGDQITLEYYMDILGNESTKVLDLAYLNSYITPVSVIIWTAPFCSAAICPATSSIFKGWLPNTQSWTSCL